MEIILKESVEKLGESGARVKVADGYARNYLLPKGLAMRATKKNIARLQHEQTLLEQQEKKQIQQAQKLANKIRSLSCVMKRQVGEQDKLFGRDFARYCRFSHGIRDRYRPQKNSFGRTD
jgi:large subunit ribosomal protein L9